ncbi:hypothetical protein KP509_09G091300 [Ceratopteris richardii]|uniref:RING-type domain-containing protein n=1 Tax=Ceratopteris richardii TaxID=49495 RepID=A0A8T2U6U6_CERRI|nr:hypothetical protein KP509_09G091300 [Ceratopteris richardii]
MIKSSNLASEMLGSPESMQVVQLQLRKVERSIQGVEPSVVSWFPTIKFNQHLFSSNEDNLCTICLNDYKEKEILRILPECGHSFHVICIDLWLRQHHTCPICRISLQVFSEWKQISGPLLSDAAKARFFPGALPHHLFEHPADQPSKQTGAPNSRSQCPTVVEVGSTGGESSALTQGVPRNELQEADRQQPTESRLTVDFDASCHHRGSSIPLDIHCIHHVFEDYIGRETSTFFVSDGVQARP